MTHGRRIAVIGLGYVGLPVAVSFARTRVPVIGFDIDAARVRELKEGYDRTLEVDAEDLCHESLTFSMDPSAIRNSDFYIVTVPTPVDDAHRPARLLELRRGAGPVDSRGHRPQRRRLPLHALRHGLFAGARTLRTF